jgi:hypothetical protein
MRNRRGILSGAVVLAFCGALAIAIMGCGNESVREAPGASSETPSLVMLNGYGFGANSNTINHYLMKVGPGNATWVFKPWGGADPHHLMAIAFTNGGLVRGVKTLRMVMTTPLGAGAYGRHASWLAQDSGGRAVHILKQQMLDDGQGHAGPAKLAGVAAGAVPQFFLPNNNKIIAIYTWYDWEKGKAYEKHQFLAMTARFQGRTNLVQEVVIVDWNKDGKFNPNWGKGDGRTDFYWTKNGGGLWGTQTWGKPAMGYVRK